MRLSIKTLKEIESEFGNFDISQITGGSNNMYIRFGYWKSVNVAKLQEIVGMGITIIEEVYLDGHIWKYTYILK
jgi:hypothetical protein